VSCLRRSWLLDELSAVLDYTCRDPDRLLELLALPDDALMDALAGRRRAEIASRYERFDGEHLDRPEHVEPICRHDARYPRALRETTAPSALHVAGGADRLARLTSDPVVAILGTSRATDYGVEIAKGLARGLAASGVSVASTLADGIAVAAQAGALEAEGRTVVAMSGGADVCAPAKRRSLYERVKSSGCAIAEMPCGSRAGRWGSSAAERIAVLLADLTVVVEADDTSRELTGAHLACSTGRPVAAIPGRVTSAASRGTHALLIAGAQLVRGPADVLELLYEAAAGNRAPEHSEQAKLEPRLRSTLESVGAGSDTPGRLIGDGADAGDVLLALSELELMGLLTRGDGGRYVPREPLPTHSVRYRMQRQMEP
jgi:DNA processing protein